MAECPKDCLERHSGNRSAIVLALSGVGLLFSLIAACYLYGTATYARASDLESARVEMKEIRAEVRDELKSISGKLDSLMDRGLRGPHATAPGSASQP